MQLNETPNRNKNKINTFLFTLSRPSPAQRKRERKRDALDVDADAGRTRLRPSAFLECRRQWGGYSGSLSPSLSVTALICLLSFFFFENHSMQIAWRTATKGLSSDLNLWLLTQYLPGSPSTDQALLYREYFRLVISSTNLFELFLFYFPCKSPAKIQLKTRTWHRQSQTITTHNCIPFIDWPYDLPIDRSIDFLSPGSTVSLALRFLFASVGARQELFGET